ncbi:hypothetical protein [Anabaena sp. FACHB-83]|nr:hypothetical protein [Anabaena sp. FACHB-83]
MHKQCAAAVFTVKVTIFQAFPATKKLTAKDGVMCVTQSTKI